ncbi:MAG: hypothetical protein PHG46_03540, partial [Candidatus Omnitrophica bacterium]|nr:hypothetical protein [Candidatus Omnitrophota bacterium]
PNGYLSSHLIGFAGIDNNGLEGNELLYNISKARGAGLISCATPGRNGLRYGKTWSCLKTATTW